jgi:hypothetical protein
MCTILEPNTIPFYKASEMYEVYKKWLEEKYNMKNIRDWTSGQQIEALLEKYNLWYIKILR